LNVVIALPQVVWIAWKGAMVVGKSGANDVLHLLALQMYAVMTVNFQNTKSDIYQK